MPESEETLTRRLLQEDETFRTMKEKHAALEEELQKLESKPYRTPQDEVEIKRIKKTKLMFKDEMQRIVSVHRGGHRGA
jgi:uncharacterized protein YdcH (DUF465 family)